MEPDIFIYNTLSGKKELFVPQHPGQVKIYACGVTTYDHYHIGHALQAIYFDIIRNYFEYRGYDVTYVRNYTDVDDKIIARAHEEGVSPRNLAERIIASSEEDMKALGCRQPSYSPKVSESIDDIIDMIKKLIDKGCAYATAEGDVYFRVRSKSDYGKLSNRNIAELKAQSRELVSGTKEDPLDFALWKHDTTPDASWPSPWGMGRPGWHIECSAMSLRYLGESFDIHGGGRDLIFPHHENEIAQSECATGQPYVRYWMHSGLLTVEKQKMSKSLGNQITVKEFLKTWPAEVLRLAFLQHHYRSNIDFDQSSFQNSYQRLYYYYQTLAGLDQLAAKSSEKSAAQEVLKFKEQIIKDFHRAMSDDFNTPLALASLHQYFKKANDLLRGKQSPQAAHTAHMLSATFRELFGVWGLLQQDPEVFIKESQQKILKSMGVAIEEIEEIIQKRQKAREAKDFKTADALRSQLAVKGIEIMDDKNQTRWKINYDEPSSHKTSTNTHS